MLIHDILAFHHAQTAPLAHVDILGDAFLLRENRIYRNIKRAAVEMGCQYKEAWPQYLSLPFHELNKIVETKTIPYIPHARMLQNIENKRERFFTTDHLQMPESVHMHEAAHVIAENLFSNVPFKSSQEKILKTMLCESFANTVDALACVDATDEMHQYFLVHNCYMNPDKEDLEALIRLIQDIGFKSSFMLILFGYLHSNFLHAALSQNTVKEFIGVSSPDTEIVVAMCEKLDPQFRVQTTEMYLRLEGYDGEVFDILDFPFMNLWRENLHFLRANESMSQILSGSCK